MREAGRLLPLLLVLVTACGEPRAGDAGGAAGSEEIPATDGQVGAVIDATGRRIALAEAPQRIVSLVPAASRTLVALGAGERLVGRTDHETTAALDHLPSVGGGLHPSREVLVSLDPDLVIRFAGESDIDTPEVLDRLGVSHYAVRPDRIEDVETMIRGLGRLVGRDAAADSLLTAQRDALDAVERRTAGLPVVRAAFVVGGEPPWVAGPGTFLDQLVRLAGGENVFADLARRYAAVSPESLAARAPDVILTLEGVRLDPRVVGDARVAELPADVQVPGPELAASARAVARALRPSISFR